MNDTSLIKQSVSPKAFKFSLKMGLALILSCAAEVLTAQEIIVEATQINEEKIEPSRSATVLNENEITKQNAASVADVLRKIPGVEVVRQGGLGQTTSVFIRGARSESTLVLIDGMEANDAMSPGCGFDFSSMPPDNIERIEVYRGPQSVRFGAGALGGVINIITKEGKNKPQVHALAELGSYHSDREIIGSLGTTGDISYSASFNRTFTKGFSAAAEKYDNSEKDGALVQAGSLKLGWTPTPTAKIETTLRATHAHVEIDSQGGAGGDDLDHTTQSRQIVTGLSASDRFLNAQLKSSLGFYFSEVDRKGRNEPDPVNSTDSSDSFLSENRKVQWDGEWLVGEYHTVHFGIGFRDESGLTDSSFNGALTKTARKSQSLFGESLTYLFENDTWFFDSGVRVDESSQVGSVPSYRTSGGLYFTRVTKAFVSYGTGYKLPSLYQLHSIYGDQNLEPENSTTFEATFEHTFVEAALLTVTGFENKFRDLIDFNTAANRYFNISKAHSRGFEVQTSVKSTPQLSFSGNYTYLESEDETTRLKLLRRPQNVWSFASCYESGNFAGQLQYTFRGERDDMDPNTFRRINVNSYSLVSVSGSYGLQESLRIQVRIDNLFDEKYEEVAGYATAGRSFFAGVSGEL